MTKLRQESLENRKEQKEQEEKQLTSSVTATRVENVSRRACTTSLNDAVRSGTKKTGKTLWIP